MTQFSYNDTEFSVVQNRTGWDIMRKLPAGGEAVVATGVLAGAAAKDAVAGALQLVKQIYPVGVKTVGPDVAHPQMVGDLKIVGPDVAHPNFIYWDKDSSSFPKQR